MSVRAWALIAALALAIAFTGFTPENGLAHAVLLRTIPSSSESLASAPAEVRLLFTEPLDIRFSGVRIVDAALKVVDKGDAHLDADDDHQLVASLLPDLPKGVYSVTWRSLSAIDVHPDAGQYFLFVGVPVAPVLVGLPAGGQPGASGLNLSATRPETTFGRWWFYLGASLFGGVMATWKLVIGPVLADGPVALRAVVHRRARRLVVVGGVVLVVGTLFAALAQAAAAADVSLPAAFGQPLSDLLLRGRFAAIWWPRIGLEVASLLLVLFAGLEGLAADCALAMIPGVLLTSSLTSHGAALPTIAGVGILVDWLHIAGATGWVGGLFSLLVCLPLLRKGGTFSRFAPRFTRFALAASAMVVLSGVVQAVFELGSWSGLGNTGYGQLVLLKIALLGAMLVLAAFNIWRFRTRAVRAELVLGVFVLGVAAVLTGTPPVLR